MNIIVDCEASGPCIGCGDLIQFAAIAETGPSFVSEKFPPIFDKYSQGAYDSLNITREEHLAYTGDFAKEAQRFYDWVMQFDRSKVFWSDNPAFDWQWINWLFHTHDIDNPFGFSARRIGDLYSGLTGKLYNTREWKRLRITKHTHDPLDDVTGNLEAFLAIRKRFRI